MSQVILNGLSEENLLSRAISTAGVTRESGHRYRRWIAVRQMFKLSEGEAKKLCHIFGFDPDEWVNQ
jgi:hypothetical protein